MSLLVLDPDVADPASVGAQVKRQLTELEFQTLETPETRVAIDLCRNGTVDLVVCCDWQAFSSLAGTRAGSGVILVGSREQVENAKEHFVELLRAGVMDYWCWPLTAAETLAGVELAQARLQRTASEFNNQMVQMRSELERDQRAGQYIQLGMLPPNPMGIGHFNLQHRVLPSLILSGDFVDYFQISDRYAACYVADVAGHGASSAFVTVLLKNFSRRLRREYRVSMLSDPGEILSWINGELIDHGIDKHVAMFFATIDMRENLLHYANAAHLPPAMMVVDGEVSALEQKAKPLGLFPDIAYQSATCPFPFGAKLVVFSDGVFDIVPGSSIDEKEHFLSEAIQNSGNMAALWEHLKEDQVGPDDISCLMVNHGA